MGKERHRPCSKGDPAVASPARSKLEGKESPVAVADLEGREWRSNKLGRSRARRMMEEEEIGIPLSIVSEI